MDRYVKREQAERGGTVKHGDKRQDTDITIWMEGSEARELAYDYLAGKG